MKGCLIRVCIGIILSGSLGLKIDLAKLLAALQHFVGILGIPLPETCTIVDINVLD
jgi:hypothetical protein